MSEAVKRHLVMAGSECSEVVYAADHDRIVAELQARVDRLSEDSIKDNANFGRAFKGLEAERDRLAERCRELEECLGDEQRTRHQAELDGIALRAEVERLQRELGTAHADASHYASTAEDLRAEREQLKPLLKEAGEELNELKVAVGFRAHTLDVIQRIDEALEDSHG